MDDYKCTKEAEIATLITQNKTVFKEIEALKKVNNTILELSNNITKLVEQMRETKDDVRDIKKDIEDIKKQPISDYNHYKKMIIGGIITLALGYLFGKLF